MSRKTTFAVAALLSLVAASSAIAQGTDTTKKKAPAGTMKKAEKKSETKKAAPAAKMAKADTGMKKSSKGMKKGGMKKDTTAKKP